MPSSFGVNNRFRRTLACERATELLKVLAFLRVILTYISEIDSSQVGHNM
jgi:hypothetical protein